MVRDARLCRAPHHEVLDLILRRRESAVSKDEATELECLDRYLPSRGGSGSSRNEAWTLAMVALQ